MGEFIGIAKLLWQVYIFKIDAANDWKKYPYTTIIPHTFRWFWGTQLSPCGSAKVYQLSIYRCILVSYWQTISSSNIHSLLCVPPASCLFPGFPGLLGRGCWLFSIGRAVITVLSVSCIWYCLLLFIKYDGQVRDLCACFFEVVVEDHFGSFDADCNLWWNQRWLFLLYFRISLELNRLEKAFPRWLERQRFPQFFKIVE